MKKTGKRLMALALCLTVAASVGSMMGCGPRDSGGEPIDSTRTQLNIGTFGGGIGVEWLKNLKQRFEADFADVSFEEGKTGVQIYYTEDKDKYNAPALVNQIAYDSNEVYFATDDALDDFLASNRLLEITDIVTEKLTKYGEDESIEDKLNKTQIEHHKRNGKYYSLPYNESSMGVIYDLDLFVQKGLYFAKGGAPSEFCDFTQENNENPATGSFGGYKYTAVNDADAEKTAGPDGLYGTYDDGLPATFDEFEQMLVRMKQQGVDALIWTGQYADTYSNFFPRAFWASYHGIDEGRILYDGGGTGTETRIISSFDSNGDPVITTTTITPDNYEEAAKQAGAYYGLKLMDMIIKGGYASNYSFQGLSHIRTQDKFLVSRFRMGERPIAMMIEGTWWENEADVSGTFDNNVEEFGEQAAKENRNFGLFPMPKVSEDDIGKPTTILGGISSAFINANIDPAKIKLAKTFLQYAVTDESLANFTLETGLPASYRYDMTPEQEAQLSGFAKQYWAMFHESDVLYGYMPSELKLNSAFTATKFKIDNFQSVKTDGVNYSLFVTEAKYNNTSLRDYFEGLYRWASVQADA